MTFSKLQSANSSGSGPSSDVELLCVRNLLANGAERIFFKDLDSRFLHVSQGWLDEVADGRALSEVLGRNDFDIFSEAHASEALADERRIIETGEPMASKVERETFAHREDAWVSTTKMPLLDEGGQIIGTYGVSRDATEQVVARTRLAHQALHDALTGLPNRTVLIDRLTQALLALHRRSGRLALLFVDLDDFKCINDGCGHDSGDRVLVEVATRLTRVARRTDTVARLGGDEFVVLCTELHEQDDLRLLGDRMLQALREPIAGTACSEFGVTGSLGAVSTSSFADHPAELMRQADLAMYAAKRAGRNRFEIFDAAAHLAVTQRRGVAVELRGAIERCELLVHYQPLFRLDDQSLSGVEALVRWLHPTRGLLSPADFIPAAEQHGLIEAVDTFVLDEGCRQLAAWTRHDPRWAERTVAVNVSGAQLRGHGLVERVRATLERHQIQPAQLCLEITETALIGELEDADDILMTLTDLGVRIALDDFGTGYSTLAHIQRLHADVIKIDRSFVAQLSRGSRDREIVAAVIAMAHALGMSVVGEGIETDGQREQLAGVACDEGQGFLFSKPLRADEVSQFCASEAQLPRASLPQTLR